MNFLWVVVVLASGAGIFFAGYKVGSKKTENYYTEQIRDIIVAALSSGLSGDVEDGNS